MSYSTGGRVTGTGYIPAGYSGLGRSSLRSMRGLGDAAYDAALTAYAADHAAWVQEQAAYQQALSQWNAAQATVTQNNAALQAQYQAALAQYNAALSAYNAAYNAYSNQTRTNAMTYGISQNGVLAQYPSIVIPAGYPGCVSQAQHNAWQSTCTQLLAVKGLGAPVPTGPECGLALLPVCAPAIPAPASIGPKPNPPSLYAMPTAPPALRPEPQPPIAPPPSALGPPPQMLPGPTPDFTPSPTGTPTTSSAGILSNGLILVVLAGGSYLLYRSLKKPKKAA